MSARSWKPGDKVLYKDPKTIRGVLTVGASGAVTSWVGYGIVSVTKESTAGQYTFVLRDPYKFLCGWSACELHSSAEDLTFQLLSEDVDNATQASRTIVLQGKTGANAANSASGSKIYVEFNLTDSQLVIGNTI